MYYDTKLRDKVISRSHIETLALIAHMPYSQVSKFIHNKKRQRGKKAITNKILPNKYNKSKKAIKADLRTKKLCNHFKYISKNPGRRMRKNLREKTIKNWFERRKTLNSI